MAYLPELLSDTLSTSTIYLIDSMPIPVCRRARAQRCAKVAGAQYDEKCYAKNERYFSWKLHLVSDGVGLPIRFVGRPARPHDTTAFVDLACTLSFGVILLGDRGSVSEPLCHNLDARYGVTMIIIHCANMQPNTPAEQHLLYARLTAGVALKIAAAFVR